MIVLFNQQCFGVMIQWNQFLAAQEYNCIWLDEEFQILIFFHISPYHCPRPIFLIHQQCLKKTLPSCNGNLAYHSSQDSFLPPNFIATNVLVAFHHLLQGWNLLVHLVETPLFQSQIFYLKYFHMEYVKVWNIPYLMSIWEMVGGKFF